jgi:predicted permease
MTNLIQDLRFALRTLSKAPVFTTVAILSLAFGIGANSAIFSLLDQLLLRTLPVHDPERIVQMSARGSHYGSNSGMNVMSYPMYRDFRDKAEVFDGVIARRSVTGSLGFKGQVERARSEMVSGNYFSVLGVKAAAGRVLLPEDDVKKNGHPVAVLAYDYWQSRFAGDASIIGQSVILNDLPFTILGIVQPGFTGMEVGDATQIFVPMAMQERMWPVPGLMEDRRWRFTHVFGRLKPGVTVGQAKASVAPLFHQILEGEVKEKAFAKAAEEDRRDFLRQTMDVYPGGNGFSAMRMQMGPAIWVLMALVGVVLLIACANVANLQLARATARQKEMAVRLAIGASRWQIMRQLLIESGVLALIAGLLGLAIAKVSLTGLFAAFIPSESHLSISPSLDTRVFLFNLLVSVFVGVLFGLAPALQSTKPELAGTLKDQAGSVVGGTHSAFRKTLVTLQVTLSLLLLIGAGLFVNSLHNLQTLNPGFKSSHLVVFGVDPTTNGYNNERIHAFYRRLFESLETLPAVESVSYANVPVLSDDDWDSSITVEGQDPSQRSKQWAYQNKISPGYFKTLGVPLKAGRDFSWSDAATTKKVTIINEQLAKEYFKDKDPIGRHIGYGSDPGTKADIEVIGVVGDFKYQNVGEQIGRQMFQPYSQVDFALSQFFYIRTTAEPRTMFRAIRSEVSKLDANLPIFSMRTMDDQVAENLVVQRLVASLSAVFGLLATMLAVIGLYGVMAYLVSRRSREIGIRMALGAASRDVVRMILREVVILVGIGLIVGLGGAIGLSRYIKSQLYGVTPNDPWVMAIAFGGLAVVALLAGWLPAARAAREDPSRVLRYE